MRKLLLILSLNCLPLFIYAATAFQPSHLPDTYREALLHALGGDAICHVNVQTPSHSGLSTGMPSLVTFSSPPQQHYASR